MYKYLFRHDFHYDRGDIITIYMAINYLLIYTLGFLYMSSSGSANAQLPGHSPLILDWTCFLWNPLFQVYIPY